MPSFLDEMIGPADRRPWLRPAVFVAVVLTISALLFIGVRKTAREVVKQSEPIGVATMLQPKIAVTIDDPQEGTAVTVAQGGDGSGSFSVSGTAAELPKGTALYLLVRPVFPAANGWWVMPEALYDPATSRWTATAVIGNAQYPPASGNRYALCLVIARAGVQSGQSFASPEAMDPVAQSKFVYVSAGAIR